MSVGFRERIAAAIGGDQRGIEFGPCHNPIAPKRRGFKTLVVDHLTREGLVDKYREHPIDLAAIEEVDVVWEGGGELPGVPVGDWDYVIASHVIEHVPDPVRFLQMCERLLKPTGRLFLLVPDKRHCFDHFRPVSTTGQVLDAYFSGRQRPTPGQIFDQFANAAGRDAEIAWPGDNRRPLTLRHDISEAFRIAKDVHESGRYFDVHGWTFTPQSFRLMISDLVGVELLGLGVSEFETTEGWEFFVSLTGNADRRILDGRVEIADAMMNEPVHSSRVWRPSTFERLRNTRLWKTFGPVRAALRSSGLGRGLTNRIAEILGRH